MTKEILKQLNTTGDSLKSMRQPYEALFSELGDNFNPQRNRFNSRKGHRATEGMNKKIVNARPRMALRTLQSGMHTGITSPARPWFRLIPKNPDLRHHPEILAHFSAAQREIRQLLQGSGMYTVLHTLWGDLGLYGYDAAIVEDDDKAGLFGQALIPAEAWIGSNARGMVDTLYREVEFTTHQTVAKFVFNHDVNGKGDWSKVTNTVRALWDRQAYSAKVPVRHLVMPRYGKARTGTARDQLPENKPIMSTYWEEGESNKLLGDLGYDESPILASRWDVHGTDTYGGSPAMDALGEAKELQRKERDKAESVRRMNRPPMNLPTEMRNSPFSLMPEAVNFMSDPTKGAVPAYQITPQLGELRLDIQDSEERINEGMYANLFMMLANLDRRQITAREIDERHEEKLLGLGPVLERQHREKLAVIIRRCYLKVVARGGVPPLPEEFADIPVEVDYTSTLGQAQKAVATGGIERLYGFVGNVAGVDSTVLDKLDHDTAVDTYADMLGTNVEIIRSDQEVAEIRQARAEQAQQQQQQEQAAQATDTVAKGAQAAKLMSETDGGGGGGARGILDELGLAG